ncbi:NUDIX domain-containing protein [Rhizobiales bacterium RZME27]|uniref:NUDIX domain-containing protein n=1 Tax=Endobacterium cereale TaxID=2663029 RepID=A0A6A8AJ08_9HYPH|nr:NUDIX domain-containing protein [Endobacterium cereale]MEB2843036.1 NUDIX domain-containing protein [Endobacterium cereale]MQY49710.1 NUDIX domain-containing protein [Endobacterium cereale]
MSDEGVPEISRKSTRIMVWLLHRYFLLTRSMTLGVRAACFDEEGRVFLVRHTYLPGWYLPGGGVERGETVRAALAKELREEGNLEILGVPQLFSTYFNKNASKRDHVLLYRVNVKQFSVRLPDKEIAESGFYSIDALPEGVTNSTLKRLKELSGETKVEDYW